MSVQNASGCIGNRLIKIITVYKNGVKSCDGTLVRSTGTFQKLRHLRVYTRRISPCYRRFSGRETDLTLCHGESGQRVHHQQYIFSLIPEIFGDCGRRLRSLVADQCRLIGSRHHDDGTLHSLFPEIPLDKLAHLTATLSDQGNDIDVRFCIAGEHTEQGALSDTGTCKDSDTLSFSHSNQPVYRFYAKWKHLRDNLTAHRIRRICLDRIFASSLNDSAVGRSSNTIQRMSKNAVPDKHPKRMSGILNDTSHTDAFHILKRHQ